MPSNHDREREVFLEAAEMASADERAAFLARACGGEEALRARVEAMLQRQPEVERFFRPFETERVAETAPAGPGAENPVPEQPGTVIGRYQLLEQIGEGGFGVVYLAEQFEPVSRRVALKIIKLGMDTREVIARFDAERQALALMDHPNVARVLDAGATASGRPFFVMELVRGLAITEFCDQHRLTTRERVELFIGVCQAAQHAHSKGIIHRDLKPSNILVTIQDGRPLPKVIDFGIAKAVQAPLTDKTLFTRFGQMIGTPVYMSPEHLIGVDVDTRSDIYSLGVILYELLTGQQPFDLRTLRQEGSLEMIRRIQEEDPPPPATRLARLGQELASVAWQRNSSPRRLGDLVRGDLDWITLKALQKDRARRYATAQALADDLQRHLEHQPVSAGPPGMAYRWWKFARRHRYAVGAGAAVLCSLIVGLGLTAFGFFRARQEQGRAVAAEIVAERERGIAQAEAERARANETYARQVAYASDMALASHSLDTSNLGRCLALLRRHFPQGGLDDLRQWEWRYLWQQCQSAELFPLGTYTNSVAGLAASEDGTVAAASDTDGLTSVYDLPARIVTRTFQGAPCFALSPDGLILVDGNRTVHDVKSGELLGRLPGTGRINKLSFSPAGDLLVGLLDTGDLFLWECASWNLLWEKPGFGGSSLHFGAIAFAPGGAWMAIGTQDGRIHLIETATGGLMRVWSAQPEGITAIAISPDETTIASASGYAEAGIKLWSADGTRRGELNGHGAWVSAVGFSPRSPLLASAGADQTICLWDLANRTVAARLRGHLQEVWRLVFLPDGRTLISGGKDGSVKVWRVPAFARAPVLPQYQPRDWKFAGARPRPFAFTRDGAELLGTDAEGRVSRWALPSLRFLGSLPALGSNNYLVASSARGLVVAVGEEGRLRVWDALHPGWSTNLAICEPASQVTWLGFAGERSLVSIANGRLVTGWDTVSWAPAARWSSGTNTLSPVSLSPDGRYLAAGGSSLLVYALAGGALLADLKPHKLSVDDVAFSPRGDFLVSVSQDGLAKLWHTGAWDLAGALRGHLLGVHCVAFSPDGSRLATGSLGNEAVKIWDLATRQDVLNLRGPASLCVSLGFSPGGRTLVALASDGNVRCWSTPLLDEIQAADSDPR